MTLRLLVALVLAPLASVAYGQDLPVSNADFSQQLSGSWDTWGEAGEVARDPDQGRSGPGALRIHATEAPLAALHAETVPVQPGQAMKLLAWVRAEEATGETYAMLELLRNGEPMATPGPGWKARGPVPGWVPVWHVLDVPPDSLATHVRIVLRTDGPGKVWFDDVKLTSLPANRPVMDGPPSPPPWGVITARGEDLIGESGQRVRLWGVNCVDEPGRDYRQITHIIRRIKAMGFNAIRLHLYDLRLIDTDARTASGELTSLVFRTPGERGDGSYMDLFDYFMYRAEKEGLYLYLTLDRGGGSFQPGDYHILPSAGPEDEAAWKEAVVKANQGWADEHLCYVDDRLSAAHVEYARQLVNHRNAYTGVRIGDDPYVALWELTNENHFPDAMLSGGFRNWPEYFQGVLQRRWNEWLRNRYGTQARLEEAWGEVVEGENLEVGSISPAPAGDDVDEYPAARLADFRRFVYDLTLTQCRRLEQAIREGGSVSSRTPITYDTVHEHKHVWNYPVSQGNFLAVGTYWGGSLQMQKETSFLGRIPLDCYNYSTATVADKPIVVYENNIHKPAADRAYFPMFVSTFASARDWDGVFWYVWSDGTVPDQVDDESHGLQGLRYASPGHFWHGIVIGTDEVLLASLRLAGELFKRFVIPPAPDPAFITVGAEALYGRSIWIGDLDVPFPADAPLPYQRYFAMGATDFVHTVRVRYDPDQPGSSVSKPLIARVPQVSSPVRGLTYDFQQGVIIVDRPEAKAVVGFTEGAWDYGGGMGVQAPDVPFFCHGIVSLDGQPLDQAERALAVFTTYGENRGRTLRENPAEVTADVPWFAKLVAGWGWGPPDIVRPPLRMTLPGTFDVTARDFALNPILAARTDTVELPEGHQLFWAELSR